MDKYMILPKSRKGYAVVKKKNPVISLLEIYETKDITIGKDEMIIKITIVPIK